MQLESNQSKLLSNRKVKYFGLLGDYWRIANRLLPLISSNTLTGKNLVDASNNSARIREELLAAIGGSGNADLRASITSEFSVTNLASDLSDANTASSAMHTEILALKDLMVRPVDSDIDGNVDTVAVATTALETACNNLKLTIGAPQ